jgi:hypothetical protein
MSLPNTKGKMQDAVQERKILFATVCSKSCKILLNCMQREILFFLDIFSTSCTFFIQLSPV